MALLLVITIYIHIDNNNNNNNNNNNKKNKKKNKNKKKIKNKNKKKNKKWTILVLSFSKICIPPTHYLALKRLSIRQSSCQIEGKNPANKNSISRPPNVVAREPVGHVPRLHLFCAIPQHSWPGGRQGWHSGSGNGGGSGLASGLHRSWSLEL